MDSGEGQTTFSLDRANFAVLLIALNWRDEEQWRILMENNESVEERRVCRVCRTRTVYKLTRIIEVVWVVLYADAQ